MQGLLHMVLVIKQLRNQKASEGGSKVQIRCGKYVPCWWWWFPELADTQGFERCGSCCGFFCWVLGKQANTGRSKQQQSHSIKVKRANSVYAPPPAARRGMNGILAANKSAAPSFNAAGRPSAGSQSNVKNSTCGSMHPEPPHSAPQPLRDGALGH